MSLIGRGWLATSGVRMLVLDEADKLLSGERAWRLGLAGCTRPLPLHCPPLLRTAAVAGTGMAPATLSGITCHALSPTARRPSLLPTDAFRKDVMTILSHLPQPRQTLALSATYGPPVLAALRRLMRRPQEVLLCEETTSLLAVKQFYRLLVPAGSTSAGDISSPGAAVAQAPSFQSVQLQNGGSSGSMSDGPAVTRDGGGGGGPAFEAKACATAQLLAAVPFQQALVFCNRRVDAEAMAGALSSAGFAAAHLSAERSQLERIGALNALRDFRTRVAVTTDLVARGVDLEGVTLVVNADLPGDAATLMHRVGRAGRFGTRGLAVTLLADDEELGALRQQLEEVAGGEV